MLKIYHFTTECILKDCTTILKGRLCFKSKVLLKRLHDIFYKCVSSNIKMPQHVRHRMIVIDNKVA